MTKNKSIKNKYTILKNGPYQKKKKNEIDIVSKHADIFKVKLRLVKILQKS